IVATGTDGLSAAWMGEIAPALSRTASRVFMTLGLLSWRERPGLSLPPQDHVEGSGKQATFVLERPRLVIVVVADFRAKDDVFARLKVQPCCQGGVQSFEAGPVAVDVVEELQPGRSAQ